MDTTTVRKSIDSLKKLPGITIRQAERIAYSLLQDTAMQKAIHDMARLLDTIEKCPVCGWIREKNTDCENCARSAGRICVVAMVSDVLTIEKSGEFDGSYHILGGIIAPLEGIMPQNLFAAQLLDRIQNNMTEEIILALPSSIEGEATVHYLADILRETGISVTRIARGVPAGSKLEFLDRATLGHAIKDRVKV